MNQEHSIAVASRSFSNNPILREELLQRYTNVSFNDEGIQYKGDKLIKFLTGHDKAILGLEVIDELTIARLPQLKVISRMGVGVDKLDLDALERYGVALSTTPGANKQSVAELVIAFAIMLLRQLPQMNHEVINGVWRQNKGRQLSDCTIGLIGFGSVGRELARLLHPFGCRLIMYDVIDDPEIRYLYHVEKMPLEELLMESDIVSLHVPLIAQTRQILDAARLMLLKTGAILINTARGGLVDELALRSRLETGDIAAAAFDVFADEPPEDKRLLTLPNFFATPHIGGSTNGAVLAMGRAAITGLESAQIPKRRSENLNKMEGEIL